MRWTVDRDFTPGMPVQVNSLIKPTQWRPGMGKIEREMPAVVERTFVLLHIDKSEEETSSEPENYPSPPAAD